MSHEVTQSSDELLEALAELPTKAQPTVSHDGDEVAFYYDGSGRNELHVHDIQTGDTEQWSDGAVPRHAGSGLAWGVDDDRIFFHNDDGGNEQFDIFAIDREGNVDTILETAGQTGIQDVGPDGERLLLFSSHEGQLNLYEHDLTSDETTKLTEYDRAAAGGIYSPDGDQIAYVTNESTDYDNYDVYLANADGSAPVNLELGETGGETFAVDWSPDGDRLLVGDNSDDLGRSGVYDLDSGTVTWFGGTEYDESPEFFVDDSRFVATRHREGCVEPLLYDVTTGEGRPFDLPHGVTSFGGIGSFGLVGNYILGDDRILLKHESPSQRPRLLAYDLETDEFDVLVDADYGPFEPDDFVDAEYFTVESDGVPETPARAVEHDLYDELEIGAMLYDSGERPSPLIVNPHGGPTVYETRNFDIFTQFLLARGYSVLQLNYRGSAGRGREFKEYLYDDWGGAEQGDIATVAEHVIENYEWIDEDRIVMYGRSFGGYSAYWQAVQYPDLYDAVISWVGLSDLVDMYENTMPHFKTELMVKNLGHPEENEALYEERSPITHVENVDSPLLILHGVGDSRVPVSQARLMDDALEEAGYEKGPDGDYEYEELGGEGHKSSDSEQKIRVFTLMDEFLDRRLA